ncbi:hypothetical protein EG329_001387 [Mollisiaceae sp. DMI_Dod_QoI]|nr:hypothetical protein EG329_001387 [Helotiales sp. DMI_Dod_QoI]
MASSACKTTTEKKPNKSHKSSKLSGITKTKNTSNPKSKSTSHSKVTSLNSDSTSPSTSTPKTTFPEPLKSNTNDFSYTYNSAIHKLAEKFPGYSRKELERISPFFFSSSIAPSALYLTTFNQYR